MPWFAVPAAVAIGGLVGKLVTRYLRGEAAARALKDPPGVRTIARFGLVPGGAPGGAPDRAPDRAIDDVLLAVAAELARGVDGRIAVTGDAVRARPHPL